MCLLAYSSTIVQPKPVNLGDFCEHRRKATHPQTLRGPDFDQQFDHTTFIFDAFKLAGDNAIMMIGPPLYNLAKLFREYVGHRFSKRN